MFKFLQVLLNPDEEGSSSSIEESKVEEKKEEVRDEVGSVTFDEIDESIARGEQPQGEVEGEKEKGQEKGRETAQAHASTSAEEVDINVVEALQKIIADMQASRASEMPKEEGISVSLPETSDEEYDNIFRNKAAFDNLVAKKVQHALAEYQKKITPRQAEAFTSLVKNQIFTYMTVEKFYAENPELAPYRTMVGIIADEVQKRNPTKPWYTLLPQVRDISLKKLALAKKITDRKEPPPAQPRGGRKASAPSKEEMTEIEKEIAELISL